MKRKRKLDTEAIFKYLVKGSVLNTGISTCINLDNNFSHVAMIKARRKLQDNLFYNINKQMHKEYILKNHIYAIDGSKVPVNYGFKKKYGYLSRTCDKVIRRPALLNLQESAILHPLKEDAKLSIPEDLVKTSSYVVCFNRAPKAQTDTIINYTITKHFNERKCIEELIRGLTSKDTVILDRGYYSKNVFSLPSAKIKK